MIDSPIEVLPSPNTHIINRRILESRKREYPHTKAATRADSTVPLRVLSRPVAPALGIVFGLAASGHRKTPAGCVAEDTNYEHDPTIAGMA